MLTETQRPKNPEDLHVNRVINDAKWLLTQHHPDLLPKEKVQLEIVPLKRSNGAAYDGTLRGVHYIFFPKKDQDATDVSEAIAGVHELVHQWHAETMGGEIFIGFNQDDHITDEELREKSPYEALKIVRKRNKKIAKRITISDAVAEGIAITVEFSVLEKELKIAAKLKRRQRIDDLRIVKKERRDAVLSFKKSKKKNIRYNWDGVQMMEKLLSRFGGNMQDLVDFVRQVDFVHTNDIPFGNPEYEMMVEDPLLLPRVA